MTCNKMAQHASKQPQRWLFDAVGCYAHVWRDCFSQRHNTAPIMALCTFGISIQPHNCGVQVTGKHVSRHEHSVNTTVCTGPVVKTQAAPDTPWRASHATGLAHQGLYQVGGSTGTFHTHTKMYHNCRHRMTTAARSQASSECHAPNDASHQAPCLGAHAKENARGINVRVAVVNHLPPVGAAAHTQRIEQYTATRCDRWLGFVCDEAGKPRCRLRACWGWPCGWRLLVASIQRADCVGGSGGIHLRNNERVRRYDVALRAAQEAAVRS